LQILTNFQTIYEAEHSIKKYWDKIVAMELERLTDTELQEMEAQLQVNCLRKGNFDNCQGKKYFIPVDGTESANRAFEVALRVISPHDHLFICTVYDKDLAPTYLLKRASTLLAYKAWNAGIVLFLS
jgi:hypothetical protein